MENIEQKNTTQNKQRDLIELIDNLALAVQTGFADMDSRFADMDSRFDRIELRLDSMENEMKTMRKDLDDVKMRLQSLEKMTKEDSTILGSDVIELRDKTKHLEIRLTQVEQMVR
jgi:Skp family chaperone for outer membrane proteins